MEEEKWTNIIKPKSGWRDIDLQELWRYRELIFLFVKRDFSTRYKQTILGPAWLIISPLVSTLISTFVFGTIAKIPSEGIPYFLFFMCGNCAWTFFSGCLTSTSSTFVDNSAVFGKVYFPRLVTPFSTVISGLIVFGINILMLLGFMAYYFILGVHIAPTLWLLLLPILIIQMGALGLGLGIIVSSLTTKYRDLKILVSFGVTAWMYITPIIYPVSQLSPKLKVISLLNPMAPIIESFRYALLGTGEVPILFLLISMIFTCFILLLGIVVFSKVEKTFMDTV